jgi:hypothetical protein
MSGIKTRTRSKTNMNDISRNLLCQELRLDINSGLKRLNKEIFKLLEMALDLLSIPAMSADLERLFLGAKITITDRRNKLRIEVIQFLECIKSWLKIIESQDNNIKDQDQDILDSLGAKQARS